jgi:hypothetical protein
MMTTTFEADKTIFVEDPRRLVWPEQARINAFVDHLRFYNCDDGHGALPVIVVMPMYADKNVVRFLVLNLHISLAQLRRRAASLSRGAVKYGLGAVYLGAEANTTCLFVDYKLHMPTLGGLVLQEPCPTTPLASPSPDSSCPPAASKS